MNKLRNFSLFLAFFAFVSLAQAAIVAQGTVTYIDTNGDTQTAAEGETISDLATLVNGAITASGVSSIDVGTGTVNATGGEVFIEKKGRRARVVNTGGDSGVTFTPTGGSPQSVEADSQIVTIARGATSVVVDIPGPTSSGDVLPGFEVPVVVGTGT
ncbi:MAG: hypothetical protein ACLFU2_06680 [Opitutales bacterium]